MESKNNVTERPLGTPLQEQQKIIFTRIDRLFGVLLLAQWVAGIALSFRIPAVQSIGVLPELVLRTPYPHVVFAALAGLAIVLLPVIFAFALSGRAVTRYTIAFGQVALSFLLVHLSGGILQAHFGIFVLLAVLAFYRDYGVLATALVFVLGGDYLLSKFYPISLFGATTPYLHRTLAYMIPAAGEFAVLSLAIQQSLIATKRTPDRRKQAEQTLTELQQANSALSEKAEAAQKRVDDANRRAKEAAEFADRSTRELKNIEEVNHELQLANVRLQEMMSELQQNNFATQQNTVSTENQPADTDVIRAKDEEIRFLQIGIAKLREQNDWLEQANIEVKRRLEDTERRLNEVNEAAERSQLELHEKENLLQQVRASETRFQEVTAFAEEISRKLEMQQERYRQLEAANEQGAQEINLLRSREETSEPLFALAPNSVTDNLTRFRPLADALPVGVLEIDGDAMCRYASTRWESIAGLSRNESLENGWTKVLHEADQESFLSEMAESLRAHRDFTGSVRLVTPQGELRQVRFQMPALPEPDSAGTRTTYATFALVEDVTETGRANEPVSLSQSYLNALIDASMEGIVLMNAEGRITEWNRAAQVMFGYEASDMLGRPLSLLLLPEDRAAVDSRFSSIQPGIDIHSATNRLELRGARKEGMPFPISIGLAAWQSDDSAQHYYCAFIHDISDRTEAEAMRRDKEAAEEANRSKSQFLANMSHELRTPLNAIIGFSEILQDRTFGDLTPKQDRYVGNILGSGRHLLQLINDILDLSKVEAGHMQLEYATFPIAVAMRNIDNIVKALAAKKNIVLSTEVPENLPALTADPAKLKQILYNLLSNAIKFTPENGSVTVSVSTRSNDSILRVAVKDTGIGIPPEHQHRIFGEFEQIDSSYARKQQGSGLGLALVKKFVEMHGGRIWVESTGDGNGTTFTFEMPVQPNSEAAPVEEAPRLTTTLTPLQSFSNRPKGENQLLALVVDDDQAAGELLSHHLQEAGFAVSRSFNGSDAILLARELNPSIITLDIQLPGKSGWEVLTELKSDVATKDIPTFIISITKDRETALNLGATNCFVKPVRKEEFLAAANQACAEREAARQAAGETKVEVVTIVSSAGNGGGSTQEAPASVPEETATPRRSRSRKQTGG